MGGIILNYSFITELATHVVEYAGHKEESLRIPSVGLGTEI